MENRDFYFRNFVILTVTIFIVSSAVIFIFQRETGIDFISFLTAGEKEVRAWTVPVGTKAPQAAGVIHTDFEKGFIRAEVIKYKDFIALKSESAVKEAGKMSVEGKEYVVEDGDIMHFRFNV